MGKGDKKTKRGKIVIGSFGVKRQKKKPVFTTTLKSSDITSTEKEAKKKVVENKVKEVVVDENLKESLKKTTKKPKKEGSETQAELF